MHPGINTMVLRCRILFDAGSCCINILSTYIQEKNLLQEFKSGDDAATVKLQISRTHSFAVLERIGSGIPLLAGSGTFVA